MEKRGEHSQHLRSAIFCGPRPRSLGTLYPSEAALFP